MDTFVDSNPTGKVLQMNAELLTEFDRIGQMEEASEIASKMKARLFRYVNQIAGGFADPSFEGENKRIIFDLNSGEVCHHGSTLRNLRLVILESRLQHRCGLIAECLRSDGTLDGNWGLIFRDSNDIPIAAVLPLAFAIPRIFREAAEKSPSLRDHLKNLHKIYMTYHGLEAKKRYLKRKRVRR